MSGKKTPLSFQHDSFLPRTEGNTPRTSQRSLSNAIWSHVPHCAMLGPIFWNDDQGRIRSFYRVVITSTLVLVIVLFLRPWHARGTLWSECARTLGASFWTFLVIYFANKLLDQKTFGMLGVALNKPMWWLYFFIGLGLGGISIGAMVLILLATGDAQAQYSPYAPDGTAVAVLIVINAAILLARVSVEELYLRGYFLQNTLEGFSNRGRNIGTAAVFGSLLVSVFWSLSIISVSRESSTVTLVIMLMAILNGMFLSYLALVSGSLGLSIGLRWAFSFVNHSILGLSRLENSATIFGDPLHARIFLFTVENDYLSGGTLGIHNGALVPVGIILSGFLITLIFNCTRKSELTLIHSDIMSSGWLGGIGMIKFSNGNDDTNIILQQQQDEL